MSNAKTQGSQFQTPNTGRPENVIDQQPESNNILSWRNSIHQKTVPGNGRYSDIAKEGRKVLVGLCYQKDVW